MSFISSTGVDPEHMAWKSGYTEGEAKFAYIKQSYVRATMSYLLDLLTYRYHRTESHSPTQSRTSRSTVTKSFLTGLPLSIPKQVYPSPSLSPCLTNSCDLAKIAPSTPSISWQSALSAVEASLDGKHNGLEPTLEYLVKPDGSVALTHVLQIRNEETNAWYEAFVDGHSGELISVTDFVAHASVYSFFLLWYSTQLMLYTTQYTVLPITKQTFPEGLETLRDPQDLQSSPLGWHDTGSGNVTTTSYVPFPPFVRLLFTPLLLIQRKQRRIIQIYPILPIHPILRRPKLQPGVHGHTRSHHSIQHRRSQDERVLYHQYHA